MYVAGLTDVVGLAVRVTVWASVTALIVLVNAAPDAPAPLMVIDLPTSAAAKVPLASVKVGEAAVAAPVVRVVTPTGAMAPRANSLPLTVTVPLAES